MVRTKPGAGHKQMAAFRKRQERENTKFTRELMKSVKIKPKKIRTKKISKKEYQRMNEINKEIQDKNTRSPLMIILCILLALLSLLMLVVIPVIGVLGLCLSAWGIHMHNKKKKEWEKCRKKNKLLLIFN